MNISKIKKNIAPLFYFLKPYPGHILGVTLIILFGSVLEGVNILFIFGMLNVVVSPGGVLPGASAGKLLNFFVRIVEMLPFGNRLISVFVIVLFVILIKCLFEFLRRYYTALVSCKIWHDVQYRVCRNFLYADYQFFLDNKEGEIIYRGFSAPSTMGITLQYSCEILAETVKLFVILLVLFAISFKFSVLILVFTGLFYIFTNFIAKRVTYFLGQGRQESSIKQTVILSEIINGIKQIKIFLSEKRWLNEYDDAMRKYFNFYVKDETWQAVPANVLEMLAVVLLGFLLIAFQVTGKGISPERLSIVGIYVYSFYRFIPSLKNLSAKRMGYVGNFSIIEGLYYFCKQEFRSIPFGTKEFDGLNDAIRFKDVSFNYQNKNNILKNLNLEIKKGKTTAIVGKSGSGKTTVVNLIMRLFVPGQGGILIDGTPLNEIKLDSWLKKIGYVSQETFIFHASLKENIVFGRPYDQKKLDEVSKLANAHQFINELSEGYETLVGDKGMKLSGGQRQRIAIARALYGSPEILIFDEATSSLDNLSEVMIQNAVKKISANHTVILIAHRLSTVMNADKIIVMDDGYIAEEGNHAELMNNGGPYKSLYTREMLIEKS